MKWPDSSPKYRKSLAESLMTITVPTLLKGRDLPQAKLLRKSLTTAFNTKARDEVQSAEVTHAISSAEKASPSVSELAEPEVLRKVLRALDVKLDGERAAANTVRLRRVTLGNALDYAVERKLLTANPLHEVKTKKRKFPLREVDPHAVVNTIQGRMLLDAVGTVGRQGPPLVAFFALMYYAALRPEEVTNLKKENLSLPEKGWGDLHLERARPEIGKEWTDSGTADEEGPLKHRAPGCRAHGALSPVLTELLHQHLTRFGTARDGRLFRERGTADASAAPSTAGCGRPPAIACSRRRLPLGRWRSARMTYATHRCPPGSTAEWRPLGWRSGPGTAWRCCCGSTRSAWTAVSRQLGIASAGHYTTAELRPPIGQNFGAYLGRPAASGRTGLPTAAQPTNGPHRPGLPALEPLCDLLANLPLSPIETLEHPRKTL
jgi:hypothetical protein